MAASFCVGVLGRGLHDTLRARSKKTSVHLTRRTAFAGVATRRDGIVITLKSTADIRSARIVKRQRASASRWYLDVKLTSPAQIDKQVTGWLARSIELSQ